MPRKLVEVPEDLWREFCTYAVRKFGYRGAIKKAIQEAIKLWLEREKKSSLQ